MNKELHFSSDSLLNKKFKTADRGYDPLEVDTVLDQIIEDYRLIEANSKVDVKQLLTDLSELKRENAKLMEELAKQKNKIKYLPKDAKEIHIDNYELLQRIGKLEMYIKERLGTIPNELK